MHPASLRRWGRFAWPLTWPFALRAPRRAGRLLLTPESLHALATDPVVDYSKAVAELGYRARPLAETVADLHASFVAEGRLKPRCSM